METVRRLPITSLALLFAVGAVLSGTSAVSLLVPGSPLEAMWRLNPRARVALASMDRWAPVLLCAVCTACGAATVGLWRLRRWGYWVAIGLLATNLAGAVVNTVLGTEPRAVVGIPIVSALLVYFGRSSVRADFRRN